MNDDFDTYTGYELIRQGIESLIENGEALEAVQATLESALEDHVADSDDCDCDDSVVEFTPDFSLDHVA